MLIPKRYIAECKEEPKAPVVIERIVEVAKNVPSDNAALLAEVKNVLSAKTKPVKYVFSVIRDSNGLMTQVVATPVDFDTIL